MDNFQPLEVVGRGSDSQLQVAENLNDLIERINVSIVTLQLRLFLFEQKC